MERIHDIRSELDGVAWDLLTLRLKLIEFLIGVLLIGFDKLKR